MKTTAKALLPRKASCPKLLCASSLSNSNASAASPDCAQAPVAPIGGKRPHRKTHTLFFGSFFELVEHVRGGQDHPARSGAVADRSRRAAGAQASTGCRVVAVGAAGAHGVRGSGLGHWERVFTTRNHGALVELVGPVKLRGVNDHVEVKESEHLADCQPLLPRAGYRVPLAERMTLPLPSPEPGGAWGNVDPCWYSASPGEAGTDRMH